MSQGHWVNTHTHAIKTFGRLKFHLQMSYERTLIYIYIYIYTPKLLVSMRQPPSLTMKDLGVVPLTSIYSFTFKEIHQRNCRQSYLFQKTKLFCAGPGQLVLRSKRPTMSFAHFFASTIQGYFQIIRASKVNSKYK